MYKISSEKYQELIDNLEEYLNNSQSKVLFDARNKVIQIKYQDESIVVKKFKIPNIINQFAYRWLRDSKAKRSFEYSVKLQKLEISTPTPIAYIEEHSPFLLKESYYICQMYEHDFEIRAVLSDKTFKDREAILEQFITFTYELHEKGVHHIDYSPGNILVKKISNKYKFAIVDVNRMVFKQLSLKERMYNFSKLTFDNVDNEYFAKTYASLGNYDYEETTRLIQEGLDKQKRYLKQKEMFR